MYSCQHINIVGSFYCTLLLLGTRVKKEALPKLLNLLSPVVHSWDLFAQQIGVPSDVISQIKVATPQTGRNYLYKCFTQALEWWVANHDNPVYKSMIDTLDPGIGKMTAVMNRALARELREFIANQQGESSTVTITSEFLHENSDFHSHPYSYLLLLCSHGTVTYKLHVFSLSKLAKAIMCASLFDNILRPISSVSLPIRCSFVILF